MEDHRNQFIAIIAGYEEEMDWFLSTNPGLPSRFPIHMTFPDYELQTLVEIARRSAVGRQYRLSLEAEMKLRHHLQHVKESRSGHFSNARFVRNVMEKAIRQHAVRLFELPELTREQAMTLQANDFRWEGISY
jgi:stage V sporulation protein K